MVITYSQKSGGMSVYPSFERVGYISRESRFTLVLKRGRGRDTVRAYLPTTGRMEEFFIKDHPFFITPFQSDKFHYRVVSTLYQGNYVLLDTRAVQNIVEKMLARGFPPFADLFGSPGRHLTPERVIGKSRLDFVLEKGGEPPVFLEIKTCTLCHNGTALFPDAPSSRALQHVKHLETLGSDNRSANMVFIITNGSARRFFFNFHTDPEFTSCAAASHNIRFTAISIPLIDPVTLDTTGIRQVPIDWEKVMINNKDRGAYILVLKNTGRKTIRVGKLGDVVFEDGYYAYVGSAMKALRRRVHRHGIKTKKKRWHIDYIVPAYMKLDKTYAIRREKRIEAQLAERFMHNCEGYIGGFGASDSTAPSHLFYFSTSPVSRRFFQDTVLDFRTFT